MSRTEAEALLLVNWKGVPYRRYELDRGVTALEGANGAGKTTVMIGAYVVLMPDLAKLRFANLGATEATGGDRGIYGRLGGDRPSYAALDLRLATGERMIAGVQLERGAEPEVKLEPFLVHGLRDDVALQSLFLDRIGAHDSVPLLARLRDLVALAGGRVELFPAKRDYFTALFDRGVTPLKLALDDERSKFNEMLRTSMVGGISAMLGSGLRSFLFREESGLADTLKRMRQNLDECRRSRREVTESRRIEQELRELYDPGRKVFAAALLATRAHAHELRAASEEARRTQEAAAARLHSKDAEYAEARAHGESLERRLQEREEAQRTARDRLDLVAKARDLAKRSAALSVDEQQLRDRLEAARSKRDELQDALERARADEKTAAHNRDLAAEGLADAEKGVSELARRAALHRIATTARRSAEELLSRDVSPEKLLVVLREVDATIADLDARSATLDQRRAHARTKREAFLATHAALVRVVEHQVPHAEAMEAAREALRRARVQQELVNDRPRLERERTRLVDEQKRQHAAREHARRLSTSAAPLRTAADVLAAHEHSRGAIEHARRRLEETRQRIAELQREAASLDDRATRLEPARDRWTMAQDLAARLATTHGATLGDAASVEGLRTQLATTLDGVKRAIDDDERRTTELTAKLQELEQVSPGRDGALQKLAEQLGGEWLAERFDDVELEEAGRLEARLGPLRDALIVDAPEAVAKTLARQPGLSATIWLVDADTSAGLRRTEELPSANVAVQGEQSWRVSPVPARPVIGRRARLRRLEELRAEQAAAGDRLVVARGEQRRLAHGLDEVTRLLGVRDELGKADPRLELDALRAQATGRRTEASALATGVPSFESAERAERAREGDLQRLRDVAALLDAPDAAAELASLDARRAEADAAERALARSAPDRARLESRLDDLREEPLDDAAIAALEDELRFLAKDRERHFHARDHLRTLDKHREALAWSDADEALAKAQELAPGLRAALEAAKATYERSSRERMVADDNARAQQGRYADADAAWKTKREAHANAERELAECGVADPTDDAVEAARVEERRQTTLAVEARREHAGHSESLGRLGAEVAATAKEEHEKVQILRKKEETARPAQERWDALETRARAVHVYDEALLETDALSGGTAAQLWQARREPRTLLLERLKKLKDGIELAEQLGPRMTASGDEPQGPAYLDAWLELRAWIAGRVPAQVSEGQDPVRALQALGEKLLALSDGLEEQERRLRGEAASVAASIRSATQKAGNTVRKLNTDLRDVSFGSITSVQLRCERNQQMDKVLDAIGGDAGQSMLFDASMPFEEALNELFEKHGGGRSGGHRLLDFREYLDLRVEVMRRASTTWETANPTRMSTGEAIGVGAAIMIVVLGAWERDAQFLRGKAKSASLRFLFLDEASRLDKDTLGNLFELCTRLGLQLLIAAPEVARAESNTTYRLVRKVGGDGRETVEVVEVSGRRKKESAVA